MSEPNIRLLSQVWIDGTLYHEGALIRVSLSTMRRLCGMGRATAYQAAAAPAPAAPAPAAPAGRGRKAQQPGIKQGLSTAAAPKD